MQMILNRLDLGGAAHAFHSLRPEQFTLDPYGGFSVCHYVGDHPENVSESRLELARMLENRYGISPDRIIIPTQTHSANVTVIENNPPTAENLMDVDGLVTAIPNTVLCINTADCAPVVLADASTGITGACHAGWRGALNGVVRNTIHAMAELGADICHTYAAIGPCICPQCFEVGTEVAEKFAHIPGAVCTDVKWPKPHINLAAAIIHDLKSCGIPSSNIATPQLCTLCHSSKPFSARRLGVHSGRMLTFVISPSGH